MRHIQRLLPLILIVLTLPSWGTELSPEITLTTGAAPDTLRYRIASTILTKAYQEIGYKLTVEPLPAARAIFRAINGESDGEMTRIPQAMQRYDTLLLVDVPLVSLRTIAISNDLSIDVNDWEGLRPYRILFRNGYQQSKQQTLDKGMNAMAIPDNAQMILMLINGRSDIAVGIADEFHTALNSLSNEQRSKLKIMHQPLSEVWLYHFLHQKHQALVPRITEQLRTMQASGEIARITAEIESSNY